MINRPNSTFLLGSPWARNRALESRDVQHREFGGTVLSLAKRIELPELNKDGLLATTSPESSSSDRPH
ncbi:hypothetical protein HTSR_1541 [Halodesulfurarchaeum formicicum]|uniref:Uncharacterized protein n=1 Tax=Halodesulfurarchaeum formicicum TaxID=1873524 RepID=A0A1D8S5T5_9EURY|nr:hypothetical protein HTSR_1541 [Halodesulfurarchaeum formicicum]